MAKQLSASVKAFVPVKHIKAFVPAITRAITQASARASAVPPSLNPSASTFVPKYLNYHHKTICDKNFDELAKTISAMAQDGRKDEIIQQLLRCKEGRERKLHEEKDYDPNHVAAIGLMDTLTKVINKDVPDNGTSFTLTHHKQPTVINSIDYFIHYFTFLRQTDTSCIMYSTPPFFFEKRDDKHQHKHHKGQVAAIAAASTAASAAASRAASAAAISSTKSAVSASRNMSVKKSPTKSPTKGTRKKGKMSLAEFLKK